MRMLTGLALAALLCLSAPVLAQDLPGEPDAERVTGGTYVVDKDHTQVIWTVDHMGITPLTGMFAASEGTLVLDPEKPEEAKLEIVIPMSSLAVTSSEFSKHLASPDLLDAAKLPTATFRSTKVTREEETAAEVEGELTLHGVTRPVTLDVEFYGAGINPMTKTENIGFVATTEIKRSEFGLGFGLPAIPDEVGVEIIGAFEKRS